jgi:Leucine-rich repeat (LRR) protein
MFVTTSIDSPNITMFTRDNSMETIAMEHNKKILFLPDKIGDAYPNLKVIRAANCSVKVISTRNFRGLAELKEIQLQENQIETIESGMFKGLVKLENFYLRYNQIEKIPNGAFEGLNMLKVLALGKNKNSALSKFTLFFLFSEHNKIKYLNGKAFRFFFKTTIHLDFNICINQTVAISFGPSDLIEITEKCGFVETKPKPKAKPSRISKKSVLTIMVVILATCAVLFCILVGLSLYRKIYDQRSLTPPQPTKKVTTLADLTISETIITEIKPSPVADSDSD